ncbi:MAG: homoserine dehydrogenase [bacterium]|jgi:homoserine dehydrogenase|nr:homoserine dehydrogenase [bacterium]
MAVHVGLIGFGTVGSGAVKTLLKNRELIEQRAGTAVELKAVSDLDLETDRGVDLHGIHLTKDGWELIHDPNLDVIIELVGGTTIAKEFVTGALKQGKDVVTANKALLAKYGHELFQIAAQANRKIHFEASVGGGIPIIQTMSGGLGSARISEIHAIINGTCNYILTQMEEHERPFDEVLQEAQQLGYAELDPTFDIEGIDAAHKITILASLCFGTAVNFENVYTEGIREITVEDIKFGQKLGYRLKLLAIAKDLNGEIEVRVHPTFIPQERLLASVRGVFNAVNTYADGLGSTILYGRGAGDFPTGHAVISDVIQCARDSVARRPADYSHFYTQRKQVQSMHDVLTEYYMRFVVVDHPGVLAKIAGVLGDHGISILSVLQTEKSSNSVCPVVFMTHRAKEGDVLHALEHIMDLDVVQGQPKLIRIEHMTSSLK